MILNDWADATRDAKHRPERPIPSGRIARSPGVSWRLPGCLLAGLVLAVTAGLLSVMNRQLVLMPDP
jgi:4-hydroxybenzoate polyprenyltransferase